MARVDGAPITEGELMAEAKAPLATAEKQFLEEVHAQKARALDRLVEKRLLEARAKKEGITVEALLDREVARKVPEPAEAILQAVYDQTKATGRPLPPFPEVKAEIAAFVKGQSAQEVRQAFLARLRAESKVESLLPPLLLPKVAFKADGPSRGEAEGPGHDRRVLGLRVRVLRPRGRGGPQGARRVRGTGPPRPPGVPPGGPPPRPQGGRGGALRRGAGPVLGDARLCSSRARGRSASTT